jgi:hypothetical protein
MFLFSKIIIMGQSKWLLAEKKRIFSFLGYCYFNLRGGLGVPGGEGGCLVYKILHRKFASCQYFRDSEAEKATLVK